MPCGVSSSSLWGSGPDGLRLCEAALGCASRVVSGSVLGRSARKTLLFQLRLPWRVYTRIGTVKRDDGLSSLSQPLKSGTGVFLLKMSVMSLDHGDTRAADLSHREQVKTVGHKVSNGGVPQRICDRCSRKFGDLNRLVDLIAPRIALPLTALAAADQPCSGMLTPSTIAEMSQRTR